MKSPNTPCGPHGHPDWLLQRAGFTDSEIATYQKMRKEMHWFHADNMAESFLIFSLYRERQAL